MDLTRGGGFLTNLWALRFEKKKAIISLALFVYPLFFVGGRTGTGLDEYVTNILVGRSSVR